MLPQRPWEEFLDRGDVKLGRVPSRHDGGMDGFVETQGDSLLRIVHVPPQVLAQI